MDQSLVQKLLAISKPRRIAKGEYICHEGEVGTEMYIVLTGNIGVYINTLLDDSVKVSTVEAGDFFGEMAIFDKKPRSASCVAEEDSLCIAISESNLQDLIVNCPDITRQILVNLSSRIRDLNDKLFKSENQRSQSAIRPFSIPPLHKGHYIKEKSGYSHYLESKRVICPVCKKNIMVYNIKFSSLDCIEVRSDLRHMYRNFDILWHYIWKCPDCGYTNFYSEFFKDYHVSAGEMLRLLSDEKYYYKNSYRNCSPFDETIFDYYCAIHINECFYSANTLLLGKLWLSLFWMYEDAQDDDMTEYCRGKALDFYMKTYEDSQVMLQSEGDKQKCAMMIAELYAKGDDYKNAQNFYNQVLKYSGHTLRDKARDRIYDLREQHKL